MGRLNKAIERIQSRDIDYNVKSRGGVTKMESESQVDQGTDLFNLETPITHLSREKSFPTDAFETEQSH